MQILSKIGKFYITDKENTSKRWKLTQVFSREMCNTKKNSRLRSLIPFHAIGHFLSFSKKETSDMKWVNPLSTNPTKWSNTLKKFVGKSWRIAWVCLIILWGWRLKSWRNEIWNLVFILKGYISLKNIWVNFRRLGIFTLKISANIIKIHETWTSLTCWHKN